MAFGVGYFTRLCNAHKVTFVVTVKLNNLQFDSKNKFSKKKKIAECQCTKVDIPAIEGTVLLQAPFYIKSGTLLDKIKSACAPSMVLVQLLFDKRQFDHDLNLPAKFSVPPPNDRIQHKTQVPKDYNYNDTPAVVLGILEENLPELFHPKVVDPNLRDKEPHKVALAVQQSSYNDFHYEISVYPLFDANSHHVILQVVFHCYPSDPSNGQIPRVYIDLNSYQFKEEQSKKKE